jgi:hypothetical protein
LKKIVNLRKIELKEKIERYEKEINEILERVFA